jgi:hypothetical protein
MSTGAPRRAESRPDVPQVLDQLQIDTAQAVRCLGDAKGCRSNLARAEGLTLPSPGDLHRNTTAVCRTGQRTYIFDPVIPRRNNEEPWLQEYSPQTNFVRPRAETW